MFHPLTNAGAQWPLGLLATLVQGFPLALNFRLEDSTMAETVTVKVVEGGGSRRSFADCRRMLVGPGVNQPDPHPGYAGFVGWQCPVRLRNGTWLVGFSTGYWHASPPTPLQIDPGGAPRLRRGPHSVRLRAGHRFAGRFGLCRLYPHRRPCHPGCSDRGHLGDPPAGPGKPHWPRTSACPRPLKAGKPCFLERFWGRKGKISMANPLTLKIWPVFFLPMVWASGWAEPAAPPARRVEVHLYGGDLSDGAPLASWYRDIGITDVWLYPLKGAFPQDQRPETQKGVADLEAAGTLAAYRRHHIRYWWCERPVPDFFYETSKREDFPPSHLWDDSPESEARWAAVCDRIAALYPTVRQAGFAGLVYDTEAYYSYQGDEKGREKPWLWGGHEDQYGLDGNYYQRGRQVGQAIQAAWPKAKVIVVYCFGYPGERWWYQGLLDGGVELYLGLEHTYGAGPPGDLGEAWYQSWWQGRTTKETCDWKRTQFPFIPNNQRFLAGLFPIDFGGRKPNYRARYFREQAASAAHDDPAGPIPVWLWPQGPFTPESWQAVDYAAGDTAEDYLQVLRDFSQAFSEG